jgi:hypothetical protein
MKSQGMRQLDGWTLFRAHPELIEASFELRLKEATDGVRFALKLDGRPVDQLGDMRSFEVIGFHTKTQPDETESSITRYTLPQAPSTEQLITLRGDIFGLEYLDGFAKAMVNLVLTRDTEGDFVVCAELFLTGPEGGSDIWVLSSSVESFESSFDDFRTYLKQISGLLCELESEASDRSIAWSFGTSNANLAVLGVNIEVGNEVTTAPGSPKPLVSLSSGIAKIEIFRSENPSQLRVERQLSESNEIEIATLSAGPPAASFICACLAPVRVNSGLVHSQFDPEDEKSPSITKFDLVICPNGASDDDKRYSIDNDGVRVKHLRDGQMVESCVHPTKMYVDLLQCLTSEQV